MTAKTEQQMIEAVEKNILSAFQKAGVISYQVLTGLLKNLDGLHVLQQKEYEEYKNQNKNAAIEPQNLNPK